MSKQTTITKIGRITPQDLRIGNWVGAKAMDGAYIETNRADVATIHCRYLHELHNCYFAIVGEELKIKY